jgi:hypothetical protein
MITVDKGTFYSGEKGTNKIGVDSNNGQSKIITIQGENGEDIIQGFSIRRIGDHIHYGRIRSCNLA